MITVNADQTLVYDSRLEQYDLAGLKTTTGLNKGGTLTLIMPPGHPAYNAFTSYRTVVTLYDNGVRQFRGRALYPSDDFYNCRTITCEGERCFLRDGIIRPYLYQDTPAAIFAAALALYNAQVDEFKRFTLGEVTVTDANDYVRLESENAETFADFFDKLIDRCGGYITFTDDGNGGSIINWLAEVGNQSNQPIEFGENLLEFELSGETDELATALLPYGAQLEDGTRVTIESVNDGQDWIQDTTARQLRGFIMATVTWDDVTEPANLLRKAKEWLAEHRLSATTLQLSAVDLSRIDRTLDSYSDGDYVPVHSKPHGIDEYFQLTDRTTDWLDPEGGNITLGKTRTSLTGADIAKERDVNAKIVILNNAIINGKLELQEVQKTLTSKIEQSSTEILLEVSKKYASQTYVSSQIQLLSDSISFEVSGGLGNSAAIRLNVNGEAKTETLDLSQVRKAFAEDTSSITLSAGTITFNSGTLIINSSNFSLTEEGVITATSGTIGGWSITENGLYKSASDGQIRLIPAGDLSSSYTVNGYSTTAWVILCGPNNSKTAKFGVTKAGALYCSDAVISGEIITIDGNYKTELDNGSLKLYYSDELCGTINTKYWSGASTPGLSLRVEEGGEYIMFSHYDPDVGSGFSVDYVLNYGWSSYEEPHLFYTPARFMDKVTMINLHAVGMYLSAGYFIKAVDSDGNVGEELLGYQASYDRVCVGSNYCTTLLRGSTVYLKDTSTTVTSDRNAKHSIEELPDAYEAFIDAVQPVRFKYNEGTSDRYHVGFIAQDVEAALTAAGLTTQDFAGYVDIDHSGELGLQYTEFIAVLLKKIKRLEAQVSALQSA